MIFFGFIIFVFGLIVGSFLNCVIYRLEEGKSFLKGRSFCPHCKHTLNWTDLIPVFSFFILGGRCRYCHKKISFQYPLVELATGVLFVLIFQHLDFGFDLAFGIWILGFLNLCFLFIVSCFLLIIFVYDLKHFIIPDKVIFPAIGIVFFWRIFEVLDFGRWDLIGMQPFGESALRPGDLGFLIFKPFFYYLLSAAGASAFFLLIFLVSRGRWLGFGDVKLAFLMGIFLGSPKILAALFLAFMIGAIIGVGLILSGRKEWGSQVPFGPFLITGTFLALFWGENLINWYLNLISPV